MFELYEVAFEVYHQDQLAQRKVLNAPKAILIANFIRLAQMIRNDQRPMCIKMIRPEIIWDQLEQQQKVLNNEIVLSNNAMTAWNQDKGASNDN